MQNAPEYILSILVLRCPNAPSVVSYEDQGRIQVIVFAATLFTAQEAMAHLGCGQRSEGAGHETKLCGPSVDLPTTPRPVSSVVLPADILSI